MDYEKIIDLDSIILVDFYVFYIIGQRMIINDGRIVDIVEED